MITNGKDKKIDESALGLPDLGPAPLSLFNKITVGIIQKRQIDGLTREIPVPKESQGVIQPLSAQEVAIKPEGQRTWKWYMLHCLPDLILKPDDTVTYRNEKYRVMGKEDFSDFGFLYYELCQDYSGAPA